MIILINTTDKIQVVLGSSITTNQLRCYASYRDVTTSTIEPKRNAINTNNTTLVDLVDSPATSTQRIVDFISVYNADTTSSTVNIQLSDNGTLYELLVSTLSSGERIEYQEGKGFSVYSSNGSIKENQNSVGLPITSNISYVLKTSDTTNSTTSYADITNLSFSVTVGLTYWFRFVIPYTSNSTANGSRFSINGPSSPTFLVYQSEYPISTIAIAYNRGLTTYDSPGTAANTSAATTSNLAIVEGIITPSVSGTLIGRFASELSGANNITVKSGAVVFYQQIN